MNITITGHHVEVTDAIRAAVEAKVQKIAKHFPELGKVQVTLTVEKHEHSAEFITHFLAHDITAKAKAADMYLAITEAGQKLNGLMQKQKDKVKDHGHDRPQAEVTID